MADMPTSPRPRVRRLLYFLPAAVFVVVAGFAADYLMSGRDPHIIPSALIDRPAPDFDLPPLAGLANGFSRADLIGKVTVVNVFAHWCTPCLAEHPYIEQLAATPGVRIFGLNYKDKDAKAIAWLKEHGNPYQRIGADRDGRVAIDWGVYGVPETFIVDRAGFICFKQVGPVTPAVLKEKIVPLVKELAKRNCRHLKGRRS